MWENTSTLSLVTRHSEHEVFRVSGLTHADAVFVQRTHRRPCCLLGVTTEYHENEEEATAVFALASHVDVAVNEGETTVVGSVIQLG